MHKISSIHKTITCSLTAPVVATIIGLTAALTACNPVDRSGEQPFAPTVKTVSATAKADSARLDGQVLTSPNSDVTACGCVYGNDTLRTEKAAAAPAMQFTVWTDSLGAGDYYAVAYATNGVGTSYGDTVRFTINP